MVIKNNGDEKAVYEFLFDDDYRPHENKEVEEKSIYEFLFFD